MAINYIAAEFKPLYTPFDYSFPPYKEYIPPVQPASVSPLRGITIADDLQDRAPISSRTKSVL